VIINTSRGGTIDESALCDALVANRLGGVGLDVLSGEPHVAGNTLRRLALKRDDVIITPHVGGNTIESRERTESFIAAKVISALEGSSA
jgi:phosphoglycerate dehydrogenase-like enzyme